MRLTVYEKVGGVLIALVMAITILFGLLYATSAQDTPTSQAALPTQSTSDRQASSLPRDDAYFVAANENGIHQVYGLSLPSGISVSLTNAAEDVYHYAVSFDGSQIAYVSAGQLWLQTGANPAESLLTITEEPAMVKLAFSPDGQSLAYGDGGVSVMTLSTRTIRTLVTDSALRDPQNIRDYDPLYFLDNDRLVINVGMWEGGTVGFYTFSTQMMQEVDGFFALPRMTLLQDGRYLFYSPARMGSGIEGFLIGTPSDNPLSPFELNSMLVEEFAAQGLVGALIDDAVEILPGRIRFIGSGLPNVGEPTIESFAGEYDFNTGELIVRRPDPAQVAPAWLDSLSPDGVYAAGYDNVNRSDRGMESTLIIADAQTRAPLSMSVPSPMLYFEWATPSLDQ